VTGPSRLRERSAGVLLHPTSLVGPFEAGDLGPAAHAFVDFVASAGLSWWQVLPLCPPGAGDSPYSSSSVFAGSPSLVSLERLRDDGLLDASDACFAACSPDRRADFGQNRVRRDGALRRAYARAKGSPETHEALDDFCRKSDFWLDAFAMFSTLKQLHGERAFFEWPREHKLRDPDALRAIAVSHADEIGFHKFVQHRFASDLDALVRHAHSRGVSLMGDAPIYVAHDSADVWANPELFQLDEAGDPRAVAGVPPDAFSDEGQLWGNPLYDWDALARFGFGFWVARLGQMLKSFDAVRLDHFIGFSRYYAVPRGETSAKKGTFHSVPGEALFDAVYRALGPVELVAEDLGVVTDDVRKLRDHFRLPGMSVLQFSFSPGPHAEASRPHRFPVHSVAYTGTHDNDTTVGWFSGPPEDASSETRAHWEGERRFAIAYLGLAPDTAAPEAARALMRAAFRSQCNTIILPAQDLLGLGRDTRMNRPGIPNGNWSFRLLPGELTEEIARDTRALAELYGRSSQGER
jgi:4-alpha-glucanotransferase